jgi:dihydropteroate synthase
MPITETNIIKRMARRNGDSVEQNLSILARIAKLSKNGSLSYGDSLKGFVQESFFRVI